MDTVGPWVVHQQPSQRPPDVPQQQFLSSLIPGHVGYHRLPTPAIWVLVGILFMVTSKSSQSEVLRERAFSVVASTLWNAVPREACLVPT